MTRPHETQTPLSYPHSGRSAGQSSPDPSKPLAFCGEKGENVASPSGEAGTLPGERQAKLAARDGACCLLCLSSAQTACQTRSELDSSAKACGLLAPWKPAPLGLNGHPRGTGTPACRELIPTMGRTTEIRNPASVIGDEWERSPLLAQAPHGNGREMAFPYKNKSCRATWSG